MPARETDAAPPGSAPRKRRYLLSFVVAAHLVGLTSALDALMSTRTAPGAIAWMVSLVTFPYVAVPAYWVFGRSKFQGYVIGRREGESTLNRRLGAKLALVHQYRASLPAGAHEMQAIE